MARRPRFRGWSSPKRLFVSATRIPDTTYQEQQTGWPAYLCGGWLEMEYEDPEYINDDYMEGTIPYCWEDEDAEEVEPVAISAFAPPLEPWDDHTWDRWKLDLLWLRTAQERSRRGRRSGTKNRVDGSAHLPQEPHAYRAAVIRASREEFERSRPPFPLADFERVFSKVFGKSSLPPPAPPAGWSGEGEEFETIWLPKLDTFSSLREWAFAWSLPKTVQHREAVVRTFEFLLFVTGVAEDESALQTSKWLALASLATLDISREPLVQRGRRGTSGKSGYRYTLSMAVAAEEKAIGLEMKEIAKERKW